MPSVSLLSPSVSRYGADLWSKDGFNRLKLCSLREPRHPEQPDGPRDGRECKEQPERQRTVSREQRGRDKREQSGHEPGEGDRQSLARASEQRRYQLLRPHLVDH